MKNVKFLLSAACALFAVAAMAQQDFSAPQVREVWGDTPRGAGAEHSEQQLPQGVAATTRITTLPRITSRSCSTNVRRLRRIRFASAVSRFIRTRSARAKSIAEKNTYTDSLMIDLRPAQRVFRRPSQVRHALYPRPARRREHPDATNPPTARVSAKRSAQPSRPAATTPIPKPSWPISRTSATITRIPTR